MSTITSLIGPAADNYDAALRFVEKRRARGGAAWLLFHGPPGTGKTCTAMAIGAALGGIVQSAAASTVKVASISSWIQSARFVSLGTIQVIVIDEIDELTDCEKEMLASLHDMACSDIVIIATTNKPPEQLGAGTTGAKLADRFSARWHFSPPAPSQVAEHLIQHYQCSADDAQYIAETSDSVRQAITRADMV